LEPGRGEAVVLAGARGLAVAVLPHALVAGFRRAPLPVVVPALLAGELLAAVPLGRGLLPRRALLAPAASTAPRVLGRRARVGIGAPAARAPARAPRAQLPSAGDPRLALGAAVPVPGEPLPVPAP